MTFLSFLCVTITRSYNQLVTSVFRKATFSGVFTNFKGLLPAACKFRLVYTLRYCAFSICSSYEKNQEEIVLMKDIFKKNEYSQFFIDKCINNFLSKCLILKVSFTLLTKSKSC